MKRSGFTIVEIALVLAIAGLIFLMAFIALPSLWASQRDADRKARVMEFISDLKTYQTNNSRGALPTPIPTPATFTTGEAKNEPTATLTTWKAFVRDYVVNDGSFLDAAGDEYSFEILSCNDATGTPCTGGTFDTINQETANINSTANATIYVGVGATCDGDRMVKTSSMRSVAAVQVLERAGRYCYNT